MSRLGKCQNFSGCLLAYRGEETEVPDGQPFVCAECGKPLSEVKASPARWIVFAAAGVVALAVIIGTIVAFPKIKEALTKKRGSKNATPVQAATPPAGGLDTVTGNPPATNPDKKGDAEPPSAVVAEQKINLAIDPQVKAEVLKRIDLMPALTATEKDKLYNSVERAKKMGLVVTVPFGKGKTALSPADIQGLKTELDKEEIAALRREPLAVLVILGYADPKGDPKMNLEFSRARAEAVASAIKKEYGDRNLVRAVAMGGSTLLDAQSMEKNRIAEVWIVLP